MKVSVIIPAYNAAATLMATLDSVVEQTFQPDEILVLDDGSTDSTSSLVSDYSPRVVLLRQDNRGVASARNALCERAVGDIIAFLDADDIWHREYLSTQMSLVARYPGAVAYCVGHSDFVGSGTYQWSENCLRQDTHAEVMSGLNFFKRYNQTPGPFQTMSGWCVPRQTLREIGDQPFAASGAEDAYFLCIVALCGNVAFCSVPLVAYRITRKSLSNNRLKVYGVQVQVFERLKKSFLAVSDVRYVKAFELAFASRRRQYAKRLMGAGRVAEAREQLRYSLRNTSNPVSIVKSTALLLLTRVPLPLQPKWPPSYRV
jgi:glycosyltransferase involved in cell wall biosynthesis